MGLLLPILVELFIWPMQMQPIRVEPQQLDQTYRDKVIVVEGVYSSGSRNEREQRLKLAQCSATFLLPPNFERPNRDNLEITGLVFVEGNQVYVKVHHLKGLASDLSRFQQRAEKLKSDDAAGWQELAQWAWKRAEQYNQPELQREGDKAYRLAIEALRRQAKGDPEKLRQLAQFLQQSKFPGYLTTELEHEALRAEFEPIRRALLELEPTHPTAETLISFAERIQQRFEHELKQFDLKPRPEIFIANDDPEVLKYQQEPVKTFDNAGKPLQTQLLRWWQRDLLTSAADRWFRTGRRNELELSEWSAPLFPDDPSVRQAWMQRHLDKQLAQKTTLSANEAKELGKLLAQERGREAATAFLETWLELREAQSRQEEIQNRIRRPEPWRELAQTWLDWFNNDGRAMIEAARLYREVLRIDPNDPQAQQALNQLGYERWPDGSWHERGTMQRQPQRPRELKVGDTAEQVVQYFGGQPEKQSRVATRSRMLLHWRYAIPGGTMLVVLELSPGTKNPLVREIHQLKNVAP